MDPLLATLWRDCSRSSKDHPSGSGGSDLSQLLRLMVAGTLIAVVILALDHAAAARIADHQLVSTLQEAWK